MDTGRKNPWGADVMRDLYESWLILLVCVLVHWNQWHLRATPPAPALLPDPADILPELNIPISDEQRWSDVLFCSAFLCSILQYRYMWASRCRHWIRLFLLVLEILMLIQLVEWVNREMWQPAMEIFDDMLHTTYLHIEESWELYRLFPGLFTWLLEDAPITVRLVASFVCFCTALDAAATEWRRSIDFLVLGSVPESPIKRRLRQRRFNVRMHRRNFNFNHNFNHNSQSPDVLIARRFCRACLAEMK